MVSRTRNGSFLRTLFPRPLGAVPPPGLKRIVSCVIWTVVAATAAAMGKTTDSLGPEPRPDPVRSFNRWKKKHSHRQSQKKQLRKQLKKPEWQVEREVISRLMQNYEKVRPALGRGRRPPADGAWVGLQLRVTAAVGCTWGPSLGSLQSIGLEERMS